MNQDQRTTSLSNFSDADRERVDQTLRFVADRAWRVTDSEFFYDLVKYLAETLELTHAFCDVIDPTDDKVVNTLALYAHGKISENIAYNLKDTPCENVIGRSACCYVDKIQQTFPRDKLLADLKVESYAGIPLWAANGMPLGLIAVMDDKPFERPDLITTMLQIVAVRAGAELERLQFVDRLQASEMRFADFAEINSDWFWEMDANLRFSYFSDRFEETTGVPPSALLGKTRRETGIPGIDPNVWATHLSDLDAHRAFDEFEHPRVKSNGEKVWLSINGKPVFDDGGVFTGYRGTGSSITERKRTEGLLLEAKQMAEHANRAKSEFLANMSHDLRTPLNAIMGFSDMMRTKVFGPLGSAHYEEYAEDIHNSGLLLVSMINDVLDLSKIEAGVYDLAEDHVSLPVLIPVSIRQLAKMAETSNQTLSTEVPEDMPYLRGDERALIQILNNLISNAIKFTPNGGKIKVSTGVEDDGCIALRVSDTGIGMSQNDIIRSQRPFEKTKDSRARNQDGTGLGLHLCSTFMEMFGGTLSIESEVDKGTTVSLRFPPERTVHPN